MNKRKKLILFNNLFIGFIVVATLLMGVGYASISSTSLDIDGSLAAKEQSGIFIEDAKYSTNNNADLNLSKINKFYQTILDSTVVLSSSDLTSSITFTITVYNSSKDNYYFKDVVYADEFYDNTDITFTLNIEKGDVVEPNTSKSFTITFKYSNITSITNNTLNSYLNFRFVKAATLKSIGSNAYTGEFWAYRDSITKIIFQDAISDIEGSTSFDVSEDKSGSVMSHLVSNGDSTYTLYLQSDGGMYAPVNSSYLFSDFKKVTDIENINYLDTSKVTNMSNLFNNDNSLVSLDLSSFDTSKVTDMSNMFNYMSAVTELNITGFNTSNVTNMAWMFQGCSKLVNLDVSSFDTSKVTNMGFMFFNLNKLASLDVSNFNTSKVTNMTYMFDGLHSVTSLNLSNFDTSKVTSMAFMFYDCTKLEELNISGFDTSNVTDMSYMFSALTSMLELDLSHFNTSKVRSMSFMFMGSANIYYLDLTSFDTSNVTNMSYMFYSCTGIKELDLSSFDMSNVTSTTSMLGYTDNVLAGYARTQADADILNAIEGKPTTYSFYAW